MTTIKKVNDEKINETIDEDIIDIDFDDFLGFANTPKKDTNGFVRGKLVKIEKKLMLNKKNRTSKELEDDLTQKCFKFCFLMEGTVENVNMSRLTGTNLRPEKVHVKAKGRGKKQEQPEYNAFTEICLRLGIIKEKELEEKSKNLLTDITNAIKNVSTENPIYIKAKLQMSETGDTSFETINIKSIETIDQF